LRARKLATVAIPQLSTGSSVLFPVAPFFRGPISRFRGCRLHIRRCLTEFAL